MARPRKISMYSTYLKKRLIRMLEMRDNTIKQLEHSGEQWRRKYFDMTAALDALQREAAISDPDPQGTLRIEAEKELQEVRQELTRELAQNIEVRNKHSQIMAELNRLNNQVAEATRTIDDLERALAEADGYKTRVKQQDELVSRFLDRLGDRRYD